ncbi:hypothetical protein ACIPC1_21185 [Streptomyces sp. NPDC087263]|uniref:hypothetical protein n=1 Tax=Streptomyces sp. NPDC087263 TaxID=3365773 RepID=UPI00382E7F69
MSDHEPRNPNEPVPTSPVPSPPPVQPPTQPKEARLAKARRVLTTKKTAWTVATALVCAVVGLSVALATSPSATTTEPVSSGSSVASAPPAGGPAAGGGGTNARSGPAEGGALGTVTGVTSSGFTLTTATGEKVTVNEASSTTYLNGTSSTTASAVKTGASILVLGTADGTTITASQVTVQPNGDGGAAASTAAGVVPFQQGASSEAKQDGQIPSNYTEGEGTIVSGSTADKATAAALAAYPGGVVDRVVQLSNGEYEVHYIGVNWPHHVFVNQDFKVVGAF